ncbi:MAG: RidA family protein [Acidobacteria bacterium]|nr:RidA family protein [Acidobacteriota bacterium]
MQRTIIHSPGVPTAVGPYSQAVATDSLIFVSGQIALDPETGRLVEGDIVEQTHRILQNLSTILRAAGSSLERTVKTTVYLKDMDCFQEMNRVYAEYFKENPPARATLAVARLPKDALIEIELVALR